MTCCWRPMPVSESSSWMSRRRHVTPLSWYSESPSRKRVRVIVTSENSIGRRWAVLSMVSDTSARPRAKRSGVPAKMTSSIRPPRRVRGPWAPRTHATASTRFDLPDPFGPTTTVTPASNWSRVLSAKDLKPRRLSDLRNTRPALLCATSAAVGWYLRGSRSPGTLRREIRPLPDPKALLPDRRFLEHLHVVDAGTRRPVPAPRHHRADHAARPPAVGRAPPARRSGRERLVAARLPEPHPLPPTGDEDAAADRGAAAAQTWQASQKNVDRPPTRWRTIGLRQRRHASPSRA